MKKQMTIDSDELAELIQDTLDVLKKHDERVLELRRYASLIRNGAEDMRDRIDSPFEMLFNLLDGLDATIDKFKCFCCPATDNLTECQAIPGSTYLLCPRCLRDEEDQS